MDVLPKVLPSDDASPPVSAQSVHPSGSISLADDPELAADIVAAAAAAEAERAAKHAADLVAALRQRRRTHRSVPPILPASKAEAVSPILPPLLLSLPLRQRR